MKQKKIRTPAEAITQATSAINGTTKIGDAVGVKANVAPIITAERSDLITVGNDTETAKAELRIRRKAFKAAMQAARFHTTALRNVLRLSLGNQYSPVWDEAGFRSSLRIPDQ